MLFKEKKKTVIVGVLGFIFVLIVAFFLYIAWPFLQIRYHIIKLRQDRENFEASVKTLKEFGRPAVVSILKYIKANQMKNHELLFEGLEKFDDKFFRDDLIIDILLGLSYSRDEDIQEKTFCLLVKTDSPKIIPRFLKALRSESNINVLFAVLRGMAELRDKRFADPLAKIVTAIPDRLNFRPLAAFALGCCHDENTRRIFFSTLEDEDSNVRDQAVLAFLYLPSKENIKILIKLLDDKDSIVAWHALYVLGRLTQKTSELDMRDEKGNLLRLDQLNDIQREHAINRWRQWIEENDNYIYWSYEKKHFVIDDEAKAAGIPTDEYRKTHPWPKEPDKPK